MLTPARVRRHLAAMRGRRVAVVGDAMLDEFLWGDATRISPEAPVPVVLLERQQASLGGAANVAANIAALGGRPILFSALGDDAPGERLAQLAEAANVENGALVRLPGRPTTVKHRVFARNKHLLRFDRESTEAIPTAATRRLLAALEAHAENLDAIVISDYAKGAVTPVMVAAVARLCRRGRIPWCVDPKLTSLRYRGAEVLKPNLSELEALAGQPARSEADVRRAAARVLRQQGCRFLLVTRGQHGMLLVGADRTECVFEGRGQAVADVTGAGDTVSAVLGLGLAAGLTVAQAAALANLAGGHVVSLPGIAVARAEDLLRLV